MFNSKIIISYAGTFGLFVFAGTAIFAVSFLEQMKSSPISYSHETTFVVPVNTKRADPKGTKQNVLFADNSAHSI